MANSISSKKSKNILRARQTFYKRVQLENEAFSAFFSDLKQLMKFCHFKGLEESMLRDRVVFGLRDAKIRDDFIEAGGDPKLEHIVGVCQFLDRQREKHQAGSFDVDMFGSENDFGEFLAFVVVVVRLCVIG